MNKIFFIFMLILVLIFIKIAYNYKQHYNKSIFEESKVKKTFIDITIIDNIFRIFYDLSILVV